MRRRLVSQFWLCAALIATAAGHARSHPGVFVDDLSSDANWTVYLDGGDWSAADGILRSKGSPGYSAVRLKRPPVVDALVVTDVRVGDSRASFGIIFRGQEDGSRVVVRYWDWDDHLEVVRYDANNNKQALATTERLLFRRTRWYHFKAAVLGETVLGKFWPEGAEEPDWQFRVPVKPSGAGCTGLQITDESEVEFRNFRLHTGEALTALHEENRQALAARETLLREKLTMQVEPMPFVLHTLSGPQRRVDVRTEVDGKIQPVNGLLHVRIDDLDWAVTAHVNAADLVDGRYQLLIPDHDKPVRAKLSMEAAVGKTLSDFHDIPPVRRWTFYMTEHTHYDVGFTGPQPWVMDALSKDMEQIAPFVAQTADWPEGCRFKWTVEVSALMKNFIDRHSDREVNELIDLVKAGSVEVCGYYLNMPTELVGHEELIRGVYYAQELRDKHGITIDTAMIDDVTGYGWGLPEVFAEAGMPRIALRANSIRGQFLWDRPGAVPRPFYWEGPSGDKVFVWYTDSYREGNFWRNPGLQEERFLDVIRRNERAGCFVDDIQLRMGGDNLPPDLDACINAREWNEKYVWPKVRVATNREFLETLERKYGDQAQTFRGDIPSWWAEGPCSSARETGINRATHDRIVAAEALWTRLWLSRPGTSYPARAINDVYDNMLHFDEHTWGASTAISRPRGPNTFLQWHHKADFAYDAEHLTGLAEHHVLESLSETVPAPDRNHVAVWNTLAWPRTEVVEISLVDRGLVGIQGIRVIDQRDGRAQLAQFSADGERAVFIAHDVPALGCAVYRIETVSESSEPRVTRAKIATLENDRYRLSATPQAGGITNWYDRRLDRELLDENADYRVNQAIHEVPEGGRDAITSKKPVSFRRQAALTDSLATILSGAAYDEASWTVNLPGCPRIEQRVRLYHELPFVDVDNVITKEEQFEPEGVYFAFPFDVPDPKIRFQIANASMQAGVDQLAGSCYDFYSIQQWADISGKGFGIIFAPLDAPVVTVGDLNVYRWADKLTFDKGHIFSLPINNYWHTNFKAGQHGDIPTRYRLSSYEGEHDAIRTAHLSWSAFYPMKAVWLDGDRPADTQIDPREPLVQVEGDPVVVSCVKVAEKGDAIVVRLMEVRGQPAKCRIKFTVPAKRKIGKAFRADILERPVDQLDVDESWIPLELPPNDVYTLRIELAPAGK